MIVILSKVCLIQNRNKKRKLIQIVPIPKSRDFSENVTVCTRSPLIHFSSHIIFTELSCNEQGNTT